MFCKHFENKIINYEEESVGSSPTLETCCIEWFRFMLDKSKDKRKLWKELKTYSEEIHTNEKLER